MTTIKYILLAEDDAHDAELTLLALKKHDVLQEVRVVVARDGAEALDYLYRRGQFESRDNGTPVLVLLDLKMPRVNGIEVLGQVKQDERLKNIPVVMLTSSRENRDVALSYQLGANAYVVKPVQFPDFVAAIQELGHFWTKVNETPPVGKEAVVRTEEDKAPATA